MKVWHAIAIIVFGWWAACDLGLLTPRRAGHLILIMLMAWTFVEVGWGGGSPRDER